MMRALRRSLYRAVGKAGAMYTQRYWHEREFHTIEQLKAIVAARPGARSRRRALAWVLANPGGDFGDHRAPAGPEQLTDTLAAINLALDPK